MRSQNARVSELNVKFSALVQLRHQLEPNEPALNEYEM